MKDDTLAAYSDFTKWCRGNPHLNLDSRPHTHGGAIGDGGYISDEKTRIAFAAWRAAIKADRQQRGEPVAVIRFERNKPGNENEMPRVISCNRLPDGNYQVFLAPQPAAPVVKDSLTAPDGWQLVPKEPTQEMFYTCEHIFDHGNSGESPFGFFDRKYKDILEAAPKFGEEE